VALQTHRTFPVAIDARKTVTHDSAYKFSSDYSGM